MVARTKTIALIGAHAELVDVQAQFSSGLPSFSIVGLAEKSVAESRERVRAAFSAMGLALPAKRIIINLAPADLRKEGAHYDLPISIALLAALDILPAEKIGKYLAVGELSLDAMIAQTAGVLPAALASIRAKLGFICPFENGAEAVWSGVKDILAPETLIQLINHFKERQFLSPPKKKPLKSIQKPADLSEVKGQSIGKRALQIAAAGGHNLLMAGPPGAGKSMLAERMTGLLPPLQPDELLETSMIHSVAGLLKQGILTNQRPFRTPHHSASMPALIGGGKWGQPGEVSLAHNGVLFLDEFPEFSPRVLDALRQPLETGNISIARVHAHITYPARFQLIAAMNPCKCGYSEDKPCRKWPKCEADYQERISGPLMDRIDLYVSIRALRPMEMQKTDQNMNTESLMKTVLHAQKCQNKRIEQVSNQGKPCLNAHIRAADIEKICYLDVESKKLISKAMNSFFLSARGYHRVLKIARTIADLANSSIIQKSHLAEALSYRRVNS